MEYDKLKEVIFMALREIISDGDELLRKKCKPVTSFDKKLWQLLDDMKETMVNADGLGLAAPQVGILRRIAVVDMEDGILELINPEIISQKGKQCTTEGCLSFPGQYGYVNRPMFVKVRAQDRNGNFFEVEGKDLYARAFSHEIDHLDGILFIDKVIEMVDVEGR